MTHPNTTGRHRRPTKHRPQVRRTHEMTPDGFAWVYRVHCSPGCDTGFEPRFAKNAAAADRLEHLEEVAPPASERCRDPHKHRTRPHDHCPLCAGQLPLPGLEGLDAGGAVSLPLT
ncbi:hypothetical protein [Nocardiopsis sp. L17-MgMaSL7]|uniref:hypothetical protein n=1 Tax=Nocardiopsis sp. L17-MgMaSL7 TaxID=1938893 RepID=UPI000D70F1A7|nr:hypothetical protein [Nocardiopsis sp. L17-MgMaSL7]PWV44558.1 hypothetical protein BDW27_12317 [Nocardiopsis sp. L17-MgMaSL7]